ncbi:PAS domain-containing sensor histidine kinase [Arcobacteraceae bacterium]|nr:PAS domain-containing sensor histidine kinase [Arcobacteraceae bacterium]
MTVFLTYNYFDTKNKLILNIEANSKTTIERFKKSILPFIESYSINEYEKLTLNEMNDQNILAIVIEDYNMGNILTQEFFITGMIRNKDKNIITYEKNKENTDILNDSFFNHDTVVNSYEDKKLAKITIYFTDKYINQELNELIKRSILITIIISIILVILLFILIKKFILNPMNKIIKQVSKHDSMGIPLEVQNISAPKEIELLSSSLNNMIDTIQSSKEQILQLNERFELTLNAVNDGIWDWNPQTDEAFFSKRWKNMLGYKEDEIENKGKTFFSLIHNKDKEKVENAIKAHFEDPSKNTYNIEIRLKCKNGKFKWILSRGNVILDEKRNPTRMLGYHTDITREKEEEKYREKQNKFLQEQAKLVSMGEMIGNIAHQWRQPLSIITTSASGLKLQLEFTDKIEKEEISEFSDLIIQQAEYLSNTIDNFRNFIKGDNTYSNISIKKTIEQTLNIVDASIKNNFINLITNIDDDLSIYGNINELIEAFVNIINNSKDILKEKVECQENRLLFVDTKKIGNATIEIKIKDSGGGIDESIINRIFEPYFTTKHQSIGTGLGLSMADKIIRERHHGVLKVNNEEYEYNDKIYKGACFTITFKAIS